jgi:protein gp37
VSDGSSIEWTEATWNPTRGCKKISPGCKHCYAERFAERFRGVPGHAYERGFDPRFVVEQLGLPLTWRKPRVIFVDSMSDLFQEDVTDEQIAAVFGVMSLCPHHTFQILTKRADRARRWYQYVAGVLSLPPNVRPIRPQRPNVDGVLFVRSKLAKLAPQLLEGPLVERRLLAGRVAWPLGNVWLGVSVEDQEYAERRIPHLLQTPAAVRFVSYEPALGPVNFRRLAVPPGCRGVDPLDALLHPAYAPTMGRVPLDWIIMGGESGPGARPMDPAWVRSVRDQCAADGADVAFFFKQWGGILKKRTGRELDGRTHDAMPHRA